MGAYGVVYSLLLSLPAVATYENGSEAKATIAQESATLSTLYRAISHYPQPERAELLLALFMSMMIFVIAAPDNPFRGEVSIGPRAFEIVYDLPLA